MITRLRQVGIMAWDLEETVGLYRRVLGVEPIRYADLNEGGLRIAIIPTGHGTYLEIQTPTRSNSFGRQFLDSHGEGISMLIFEVPDVDASVTHLESHDVRISRRIKTRINKAAFIHPDDVNGTRVELVQPLPPQTWHSIGAGNIEQEPPVEALVQQIRQVTIVVQDLEMAISRWTVLFGITTTSRLRADHDDPGTAILPVGKSGTFIELATPSSSSFAAQRFLDNVGESPYLLIFQTPDLAVSEAAIRRHGEVHITQMLPRGGSFRSFWLHPHSMKGVFTQLSQVVNSENPWPPAGDIWYM